MSYDAYRLAGQRAFAAGKARVVPISILIPEDSGQSSAESRKAAEYWYRGWDQANLAAPVPEHKGWSDYVIEKEPSCVDEHGINNACVKCAADVLETQDIETVDELIAHLEAVRREAGKNLPLSVSVYQETPNNAFGSYYEDRKINKYVAVQKVDGAEFVELCI
jgi:hypothetical protein